MFPAYILAFLGLLAPQQVRRIFWRTLYFKHTHTQRKPAAGIYFGSPRDRYQWNFGLEGCNEECEVTKIARGPSGLNVLYGLTVWNNRQAS